MKLGPVTNLEKKNTAISKKFDDGVISEFATSLSWIYGQFRANQKSASGRIVCKTYIFITKFEVWSIIL